MSAHNSPRDTFQIISTNDKFKVNSKTSNNNTIYNKNEVINSKEFSKERVINETVKKTPKIIKSSMENEESNDNQYQIKKNDLQLKDGKLAISNLKNHPSFNNKNPLIIKKKDNSTNPTPHKVLQSLNNSLILESTIKQEKNVSQYPQTNININNLNVIVNNNGNGKLEISEVIRPILNDIYQHNIKNYNIDIMKNLNKNFEKITIKEKKLSSSSMVLSSSNDDNDGDKNKKNLSFIKKYENVVDIIKNRKIII